ncbi:mercuric resistance operon regulatory protein [bacterium BMS3Abin02]|nr:mercuric resistance operon regulatory protein [bacterium BMS3Abin02]GBE22143.1 mercuric resistance operon regulatory protein [bacterium BMS3Bbin01]HDH25529.1 heavy metal-responsive transcriptional regulator [Actinomycetota bacterium]HDK44683.1 heavy metal-responsive transcriptional regulator [Actinomycetota bacterium]HDL50122.1 heavy metal-responsive transcriptional regulator [Actinomycetota bacterium]
MKIGELAQHARVSTKAIRYYEDIGLLPAPRRAPNGYRVYEKGSVDRLLFIRDAQATGLTLAEIASILDLRDKGETTCHHVLDLLERHMHDLDAHIKALKKTRRQLAELAEHARNLDPSKCTDPNRCQTIIHHESVKGATASRHVHKRPARHTHGA